MQFNNLSEHLAGRGMVAVQVEYRLLDGKTNDPPTKSAATGQSTIPDSA